MVRDADSLRSIAQVFVFLSSTSREILLLGLPFGSHVKVPFNSVDDGDWRGYRLKITEDFVYFFRRS